MPGWGAFRYVNRFLEIAQQLTVQQLTVDDISYINFVAFRSAGDSAFRKRVYDQAWNAYTRHTIETIDPSMIVPLGQVTGHQIRRLYSGSAEIAEPIHRSRGDSLIPPEGEEDIARAVHRYRTAMNQ